MRSVGVVYAQQIWTVMCPKSVSISGGQVRVVLGGCAGVILYQLGYYVSY